MIHQDGYSGYLTELKNKERKELNIDIVNIPGAVMSQSEVILKVYADVNLKPQTRREKC